MKQNLSIIRSNPSVVSYRSSFQLRQIINMLHQFSKSLPMQMQEICATITLNGFHCNAKRITSSRYGRHGVLRTSNIYRFGYFLENHA